MNAMAKASYTAVCVNHPVGQIAGEVVLGSQWDEAFKAFEEKVRTFNRDTKTRQVPHPGFAESFAFCPLCGTKFEKKPVKLAADCWV